MSVARWWWVVTTPPPSSCVGCGVSRRVVRWGGGGRVRLPSGPVGWRPTVRRLRGSAAWSVALVAEQVGPSLVAGEGYLVAVGYAVGGCPGRSAPPTPRPTHDHHLRGLVVGDRRGEVPLPGGEGAPCGAPRHLVVERAVSHAAMRKVVAQMRCDTNWR